MPRTYAQSTGYRKAHRRSQVTDLFGRLRGLGSAAAHRRELQAPADVVALLEACKARGQGALVRARVLCRRFLNVLAAPAPRLTTDLILEAQAADQMEDSAEHEYHVTGTPEARARWLRARHVDAAQHEALTRALEAGDEVTP